MDFANRMIGRMEEYQSSQKMMAEECLKGTMSLKDTTYKGHVFTLEECSFAASKLARNNTDYRYDFLLRDLELRQLWLHKRFFPDPDR